MYVGTCMFLTWKIFFFFLFFKTATTEKPSFTHGEKLNRVFSFLYRNVVFLLARKSKKYEHTAT